MLHPLKCFMLFSSKGYLSFQGMNFIAGILLLVVKNEEKTFWLMDTIVNDMFPGKSYHLLRSFPFALSLEYQIPTEVL